MGQEVVDQAEILSGAGLRHLIRLPDDRGLRNQLLTIKWQLSAEPKGVLGSYRVTPSENNLPEFEAPPLNEVVMGIQFQPVPAYQQILSHEVWRLFRDQFPVVQEHPPLGPQFETFGMPSAPQMFPINLISGASHDRFWFLSEFGSNLIQFQPDRLLHNWRKVEIEGQEYPRFENVLVQFRTEMQLLEAYFARLGSERLVITQCELSYLNQISLPDLNPFRPQEWFSFVATEEPPIDEFFCIARQILTDGEGRPYGRLHRESATGADRKGARMLTLNLTARGRPRTDTIDGTLDFLANTRHMIAEEFLRSTTPAAHERWGRVR